MSLNLTLNMHLFAFIKSKLLNIHTEKKLLLNYTWSNSKCMWNPFSATIWYSQLASFGYSFGNSGLCIVPFTLFSFNSIRWRQSTTIQVSNNFKTTRLLKEVREYPTFRRSTLQTFYGKVAQGIVEKRLWCRPLPEAATRGVL